MESIDLLRKKIREILEEDYRFQYGNKSFLPNDQMKKTCKNAVDAVTKNKLTGKGEAEGTGLKKAYSIMNGEPMSHGQLKRMKAFFDNNSQSVSAERSQGKTLENSGIIQSWELWGGDAGKRWSERMINQRNSSNNSSKTIRGASGIRTKTLMDPHNTRIHR